jgi:hypothetical protein
MQSKMEKSFKIRDSDCIKYRPIFNFFSRVGHLNAVSEGRLVPFSVQRLIERAGMLCRTLGIVYVCSVVGIGFSLPRHCTKTGQCTRVTFPVIKWPERKSDH